MFYGAWMMLLTTAVLQAPAAKTVSFSVWAVQANQENRATPYLDSQLESICKALTDLPFNTFRAVGRMNSELSTNSDHQTPKTMPLDDRYTLSVTFKGQDAGGQIRLELWVEAAAKNQGDPPVRVLTTRLRMAPGEMAAVRGLKRDGGEMVLVFRCGTPPSTP